MPLNVIPIARDWPFRLQLWSATPAPGAELLLTAPGREIILEFWQAGRLVLGLSEIASIPAVKVVSAVRGVIEVCLARASWQLLNPKHTAINCKVYAYGQLRGEFALTSKLPSTGSTAIAGDSIYGSPRQLHEYIGAVPGADVSTVKILDAAWTLSAQSYWECDIPAASEIYGLWLDGAWLHQVDYAELATATSEHSYSRIAIDVQTHRLVYCGANMRSGAIIETAATAYVLRYLKEATAEVNRRTGQFFDLRQVHCEVHRGLHSMRQLFARNLPVHNHHLKIDCYGAGRGLLRTYTESDLSSGTLHLDSESGVLTLNQSITDWWENENSGPTEFTTLYGHLPRGENNIDLTYRAGYEQAPVDIHEAAALIAAQKLAVFWNTALSQGLSSLSVGCVSLNFTDLFSRWFEQWNQRVTSILDNYQHIDIEVF